MTEIVDHIEGRVSLLKDDRLRALGTGLLSIVEFLTSLDSLTPSDEVRIADLKAERARAFQLLDQLVGLGYRDLAVELDDLPEQVLVERLRAFGQSWAAISGHMDISTAGLHKRHNQVSDSARSSEDSVVATEDPATSTDSSHSDGFPAQLSLEPSTI